MISTLAYTLPEPNVWLFRASFWGIVIILVLGGMGIYRASQERFALHRNTKDVFLSMPVTLLNWASFILLLWIGRQDTDLLSSMKSEAAQAATVWLGTFAIAVAQAKKFNPGISPLNAVLAGSGRLLLGTLSQIFALLIPLGAFFAAYGSPHGRRSHHVPHDSGFEVQLFIISLTVSIFQFVWSTVYETDKEEVNEKMGWVYAVCNVLIFALACWGGNVLCEHYEAADTDTLLRAVEKSRPNAIRRIIAFNPHLYRKDAILAAADKENRRVLRALIRSGRDLDLARKFAENNGKQKLSAFLQ